MRTIIIVFPERNIFAVNIYVTDLAELYHLKMNTLPLETPVITQNRNIPQISNTVIIGINRIGLLFYNKYKQYPKTQQNIVGFINIYDELSAENLYADSINIIGTLENFESVVRKYNIHYALIAVDGKDISLLHKIVTKCRTLQVTPEVVSESQDVIYGHTVEQIFKDLQRPWEFSVHRFFDVLIVSLFLTFFLPLWLLVSVIIKLDSKGAVLFSQERMGKDGRIFRVFKFRTMYIDAEELTGPVLATKDDPRITPIGRILRKSRIDEIPQLINVLIGDISFIGPRPERPYFVEKYSLEIPMYKNRLKMRPGLTGLAQVTTGHDTDIEDVRNKLKWDLKYLENSHSILLNIKILFKTVWVVITGQGQ